MEQRLTILIIEYSIILGLTHHLLNYSTLALQQLYMGKERDDQKAQRSYKESSYSPTYKQSGQDC